MSDQPAARATRGRGRIHSRSVVARAPPHPPNSIPFHLAEAPLDKVICRCSGKDPACPDCGETGVVDRLEPRVNASPWLANVYLPDDRPYYECHPTSHVRCRFCGRRIKREKIHDHVKESHGDT